MLHPSSNLISAQQINYAAGTSVGAGYTHEMLSLEEAEAKKIPNLTLVQQADRQSTRLNSSHLTISYAVFCLKKKIYRGGDRYTNSKSVVHSSKLP